MDATGFIRLNALRLKIQAMQRGGQDANKGKERRKGERRIRDRRKGERRK